MLEAKEMLHDYEVFYRQKNELFNLIMKVQLNMVKREDLILPVGLLEKQYKAMDDYTKALGLSLALLGVEIPDIE